jgi:hypothetical protein
MGAAAREAPGDEGKPSGFSLIRGVEDPPLIDVGPGTVPFENNLASFAAEDDLEVTPPDRGGVAAAHGTGCRLVLERKREGFDLDL